MVSRVRKYYISIGGTARRLLKKVDPELYCMVKSVVEDMYLVEARNGEEAKKLFKEQYPAAAVLFEIVAEKLKIAFPKVLRAYPAYPAIPTMLKKKGD